MRKLVLIVHTSLDGFVAGVNGELTGFDASEESLQFVADITDDADATLMGRVSFQLLDAYWPTAKDLPNASAGTLKYSTWYKNTSKFIVSTTLSSESLINASIISKNVPSEILRLKEQPGKDILIFGSPGLFQSIANLGLIDEYWIFINPALFGRGIPLFAISDFSRKLSLLTTKQFSNGEIAMKYMVGDPH